MEERRTDGQVMVEENRQDGDALLSEVGKVVELGNA